MDVATGNGLFTDQLLTLPGVRGDVPVTLSYNSTVWGSSVPSAVAGTGSGWSISGFDQRMVTNSDNSVSYYGPGGLTGVFLPVTGGGFTAPTQFRATLAGSGSAGYTLTGHRSAEKLTFNASGG